MDAGAGALNPAPGPVITCAVPPSKNISDPKRLSGLVPATSAPQSIEVFFAAASERCHCTLSSTSPLGKEPVATMLLAPGLRTMPFQTQIRSGQSASAP